MQLFEAGSLHVFIHLCQKKPKSGPNFPDLHQVTQSYYLDPTKLWDNVKQINVLWKIDWIQVMFFFLLKQMISTEMRFFSY